MEMEIPRNLQTWLTIMDSKKLNQTKRFNGNYVLLVQCGSQLELNYNYMYKSRGCVSGSGPGCMRVLYWRPSLRWTRISFQFSNGTLNPLDAGRVDDSSGRRAEQHQADRWTGVSQLFSVCFQRSRMRAHGHDGRGDRGGLETLFANAKSITLDLHQPFNIRHLISELATHVRPSTALGLFCSPGPEWDIKPGILPLVNDEDWELLEPSGMEAVLKQGDSVLFISTLHGGWWIFFFLKGCRKVSKRKEFVLATVQDEILDGSRSWSVEEKEEKTVYLPCPLRTETIDSKNW